MDKLKNFIAWATCNSKYVLLLFVAGLAFYAGFFVCKHYNQNVVTVTETVEVEKPIIKEVKVPVEVKGDTVIQYVEKQAPTDADVEITHPAPVISVDYNGTKTELTGLSSESQKFEDGKLQVEQKTETVLDVTPIIEREVETAVAKQKLTDEADKEKAVQEEKHKAHKHGQKTFLYGLGAAGLLLAF